MHRQLGGSTKGLSTERLCTGKEDRCTLLPFHPLMGYPAVETESGRWQAHNTQQTTLRINKPVDTLYYIDTRDVQTRQRIWEHNRDSPEKYRPQYLVSNLVMELYSHKYGRVQLKQMLQFFFFFGRRENYLFIFLVACWLYKRSFDCLLIKKVGRKNSKNSGNVFLKCFNEQWH